MPDSPDLSLLARSRPPPTELGDWIAEQIERSYTINRKRQQKIEQLRRHKPKGYTQKIVELEKAHSAHIGYRNALADIQAGLNDGSLTFTPPQGAK